jgi:hypothetical protein
MKKLYLLGVLASLSLGSISRINASPCANRLLRLYDERRQDVPKRLTLDWLRKNLLLGFEMTFTNDVIEGIGRPPVVAQSARDASPMKRVQFKSGADRDSLRDAMLSIPNYLTMPQADEVLTFLFEVLRPKSGFLLLHGGNLSITGADGQPIRIHTADGVICFYMLLADGREVTLNIEEGAVEVNQVPPTIEGLHKTWFHIMDRAATKGFVGNHYFGGDGGGAHLNLGFRSTPSNLFLAHPAFLAQAIALPLLRPEILYILKPLNDYGEGSQSETPYFTIPSRFARKPKYDEAITQYIQDLIKYFEALQAREPWSSFVETANSPPLREIPASLRVHTSFISLKKFGADNPYMEWRFPRALNSFEEVKALAEFAIYSLASVIEDPLEIHRERLENLRAPQHFSTLQLKKRFAEWLSRIKLPERFAASLYSLGGTETLRTFPFQVEGRADFFRSVQVHLLPHRPGFFPSYEISFSKSSLPSTFAHILRNGEVTFPLIHDDRISIPLETSSDEPSVRLISFADAQNKILATFEVRITPNSSIEPRIEIREGSLADATSLDYVRELLGRTLPQREMEKDDWDNLFLQLTSLGISKKRIKQMFRRAWHRPMSALLDVPITNPPEEIQYLVIGGKRHKVSRVEWVFGDAHLFVENFRISRLSDPKLRESLPCEVKVGTEEDLLWLPNIQLIGTD